MLFLLFLPEVGGTFTSIESSEVFVGLHGSRRELSIERSSPASLPEQKPASRSLELGDPVIGRRKKMR